MGRPRVNAALPRHASSFIDNRGKERVRFRRTGWRTHYAKHPVGSPEFTQEYREWERGGKIEVGAAKIRPGSFDDLIARFYKSKQWNEITEGTQYTYRGELERFRAKFGDRLVSGMTARHVANLMGQMADTPSAANNLKKRLGQLFDFAAQLGWRKDNPARLVASIRIKGGGYQTWQEEQIAQFENHWPIGTTQRLAFDLALYTAQRRSDVRVMGPQHVKNGEIRVVQHKTGTILEIPLHPALKASIAATKTNNLAFLISERGKPFTEKGFGMWFMRQCRAAGLNGYSMHGLRKAFSRRMAEAGLSNQLIKSITGHRSDSEVARYTRDAGQVLMARTAMAIMASSEKPELASTQEGGANAG